MFSIYYIISDIYLWWDYQQSELVGIYCILSVSPPPHPTPLHRTYKRIVTTLYALHWLCIEY